MDNMSMPNGAAARLERDKRLLADGITAEFGKVDAILLTGGYGRGEGAWIVRADGECEPYNDYDLTVITDKRIDNGKLNALREKLARELGIHWVDIDVRSKAELAALKCLIKSIDLISASECIYGDARVLESAAKLDAARIGFQDIYKLYFTRMWTFLGSFSSDFTITSEEDAMFFKNQMAKATLAVCDVILIGMHAYHTSYRERARRVIEAKQSDALLTETVKWALCEKLRPSAGIMGKEDARALYSRVITLYKKYMYDAMGARRVFFTCPTLTVAYHILSPHYVTRLIYQPLVKRTHAMHDYIIVNAAQNYIFHAWGADEKKRTRYTRKCAAMLTKVSGERVDGVDYDETRLAAARIRNEV